MIDDKTRKLLREPFPPEAISPHESKPYLSTIKAIYITERLNDVFGIDGWTIEHEIFNDTDDYVTVKGRIVVWEGEFHELGQDEKPAKFYRNMRVATPYQYGGHKKTGTGTEPADGYKSAVTDCQSKCASYLEIGIDVFKGLGDKKQPEKKFASDKQVTDNFKFLETIAKLKKIIETKDGNTQAYYDALKAHGFKHGNEMTDRKKQKEFYNDLKAYAVPSFEVERR